VRGNVGVLRLNLWYLRSARAGLPSVALDERIHPSLD
jgi:hypothetical protein